MKKLSTFQVKKMINVCIFEEFSEEIFNLKIGEGLLIKEKEWKRKTLPTVYFLNKFNRTPDGRIVGTRKVDSGWVVFKIKEQTRKKSSRLHTYSKIRKMSINDNRGRSSIHPKPVIKEMVDNIINGNMSAHDASMKYNIKINTVYYWVRKAKFESHIGSEDK